MTHYEHLPKIVNRKFHLSKTEDSQVGSGVNEGVHSVLWYRCCHCESPVPPGRGDCVVVSLFAMTETEKCALTIECLLKPLGAPQALGPAGTPVLTEPFFTPPNGPVA